MLLAERQPSLAALTVWAACYYFPMKYLVTLLMICPLVACSSEPTVTHSEFDTTVATLESEIQKLSPRHTDDNIRFIAETEDMNIRLTELNEELQTKQQTISELSNNLNQKQDEIAELKANVVVLSEEMDSLKELAHVKEYSITVEQEVVSEKVVEQTLPTNLPSSSSIFKNSQDIMPTLDSFLFDIDMSVKANDFEFPMNYQGRFEAPESLFQTLSIEMIGLAMKGDFIKINNDYYEKEPMSGWAVTDKFGGIDPRDFWTGADNLLAIPVVAKPIRVNLEGIDVYKITWSLADSDEAALTGILPFLDIKNGAIPDNMLIEYWIDTEKFHLRRCVISMEGKVADLNLGMPIESDIATISMEINLSAFNDAVEPIVAPNLTP